MLQPLTSTSLATADFPFMAFRRAEIGMAPVWLSRMTYTGDLGYEIWCAPEYQRYLFDLLWEAGQPHGMALFGFRALITMRLEKHFGTWFREYRPIYTPLEAGMDRYLKFDHEFIGREAVEAELAGGGPQRRMVMFEVDGLGLDKVDRAILEAIIGKFQGGPVGLGTLAIAVGEEPETVEDAYEPFLLQSGLIQRTPRGRLATALAYRHLGIEGPGGAEQGRLIQ